mgnify:CR=1 FL=1
MYLVNKSDCRIIEKKKLTENVLLIKYGFIKDFEWKPGQYVGISISSSYRRSYSIYDYDGENISFLIDIRPDGKASHYFKSAKVGNSNQILGPYGKFSVIENNKTKNFICTGTGIAPFIPMIKSLENKNSKIRLFFGVQKNSDDFAYEIIQNLGIDLEYSRCVTREEPKSDDNINLIAGRVTKVLDEYNFDFMNDEFYICGAPQMVEDSLKILEGKGAKNVIYEKY